MCQPCIATDADLARRLNAAAEGADFEGGLTSDAEISDVDHTCDQQTHPDSSNPGGQDSEEEVDIMNSPLQRPWGTQVGSPVCVMLCGRLCNKRCGH